MQRSNQNIEDDEIKGNFYESGMILLTIERAQFDDSNLIRKRNSFVQFEYDGQTYKTSTVSGESPSYYKKFELQIDSLNDEIEFNICDSGLLSSTTIGICNIKLSSLCINGAIDSVPFLIFDSTKLIGTL